jgi:GntR family transcriptional regulator
VSGTGVLTEHIDPASDRAVYKQIADHLRAAIARGQLPEGEQLPSEARLMEHYGVARMTVRNALRILLDEGLTTAEHGRGVYVRSRPPVRRLAADRFAQRHRKEGKAAFLAESERVAATPLVDMIRVGEALPPAEVADRLGLPDDAPAVVRSRRYSLNGRPVWLTRSDNHEGPGGQEPDSRYAAGRGHTAGKAVEGGAIRAAAARRPG